MSPIAKLATFAGFLVLVFGVATVVGSAIGPDREGSESASAEHGGGGHGGEESGGEESGGHGGEGGEGDEGGHGETAADPVRGLAVSDGGLTLDLQETEPKHGRPGELAFRILGPDGQPVRDFEVEHEKRMHTIVVRRDGRGFQHVHPELGDDGVWRVPLTLPDAGAYRVFADFTRDGEAETLAADLTVDGDADYRQLPAPAPTDTTEGYEVELDAGALRAGRAAELSFNVRRDGKPIRTEPYLGAGGHLVALRESDLAYLHVHPEGDSVSFMTEFPSEGRYRLYLQFKHGGRVHTAEFTQQVAL